MYGNMLDGLPTLIATLFIIAVLATPLAIWGWLREPNGDVKAQAVERGYALHCPDDGEWAWKGECETQPESSE